MEPREDICCSRTAWRTSSSAARLAGQGKLKG